MTPRFLTYVSVIFRRWKTWGKTDWVGGGCQEFYFIGVVLEMSNRSPSVDFKWACIYMNLKFRVFLGSSLGIIGIKMVFRAIDSDETT